MEPFGSMVWKHRPGGTVLMPGPMYHNGPFTSAMAGLLNGSTMVLMPRFDAEGVLRLVQEHRATCRAQREQRRSGSGGTEG